MSKLFCVSASSIILLTYLIQISQASTGDISPEQQATILIFFYNCNFCNAGWPESSKHNLRPQMLGDRLVCLV
jgi:hypothetical protein